MQALGLPALDLPCKQGRHYRPLVPSLGLSGPCSSGSIPSSALPCTVPSRDGGSHPLLTDPATIRRGHSGEDARTERNSFAMCQALCCLCCEPSPSSFRFCLWDRTSPSFSQSTETQRGRCCFSNTDKNLKYLEKTMCQLFQMLFHFTSTCCLPETRHQSQELKLGFLFCCIILMTYILADLHNNSRSQGQTHKDEFMRNWTLKQDAPWDFSSCPWIAVIGQS